MCEQRGSVRRSGRGHGGRRSLAVWAAALALPLTLLGAGPAWAKPGGSPTAAGTGASAVSAPHHAARVPAAVRQAVAAATDTNDQAELTAPGGESGDRFGISVALSGNTMAVGDTGLNYVTGAVFIFTESAGTWTEQAELTASDAADYSAFGSTLALSGNTLVVSAPYVNNDNGEVYVFTGSGSTWTQQANFTDPAGGSSADFFGESVAVSGDTVVAGAEGANGSAGVAYVFTGSGGTWTQQAELTASDGGGRQYFGYSVAVSAGTIMVGAPSAENNNGAAYVFTQSGGTWTQQAELSPGTTDLDGWAVALDGDTAVIGAPGYGNGNGTAFVLTGSGSTWTQQAQLIASDSAWYAEFGSAVAVSGSTVVVGSYAANNYAGSAYVFTGSGGTWTQQAELTAPDEGGNDNFGASVAVSGGVAAIGSPAHASADGAVYTFSTVTQSISFTAPATGTEGESAPLTATSTSGLPVTFSVDPSSGAGVCSVSGDTVTYNAPGSCVIDADQAGDTAYLPAPEVTGTVTVGAGQAPVFVTDSPPLSAVVGRDYSYTFAASGPPAPGYALATGAPSWLSVDASTGQVSGTPPTGITSFTYSVVATNLVGTATAGPFTVAVLNPAAKADVSSTLACPASLTVGSTGTCTLTVTNAGPANASKVRSDVQLPATLSRVSCTPACTKDANVYTWRLPFLSTGASTQFVMTVKADRTRAALVLGAAVARNPDPDPQNNISEQQFPIRY